MIRVASALSSVGICPPKRSGFLYLKYIEVRLDWPLDQRERVKASTNILLIASSCSGFHLFAYSSNTVGTVYDVFNNFDVSKGVGNALGAESLCPINCFTVVINVDFPAPGSPIIWQCGK